MAANGSSLARTMGNAKRSPELGMGAFQNYQDAAYQQAQRNIAPQQEAQLKAFDQQMVNKGIPAGSKAYNLAQAQMQRGQNDQNQAANFGAMQFGQGAQEQAFGQDFKDRSLAQNQDQFGRTLTQNESQFGRSLAEGGRQFDTGMSQRESEFGRNFGLQEDSFGLQTRQADMSNLFGMGDMALKFGNFANQGIMSDANLAQGQLGSAPDSGVNNIDTQGAYNAGMTGANNVYQGRVNQYGATIGAIGNAAGAMSMPSALEFKIMKGKTTQKKKDHVAAVMLSLPIYDWHYKPQYREKGDRKRFGCLADDFNEKIIGDGSEQTIDVQRYLSALHITMQELFYENKRLENLLWHVAEAQGIPLDGKPFVGKRGMGQVFDIAEKLEPARNWKDVPAEAA